MERIGIEDTHQNLAGIIKRVEVGEEIILTRYGKDIAHITMPDIEKAGKTFAFFSLLKQLKARASNTAAPEEIKQWVQEGRE